ncbi:hypothetical protein DDV96_12200 [Marixanthomonas spongiae]|uniref:Uncharacterized protein n=1 Tax=Marixanthomonas spongiae TaxID=2174845 RepID=A0A2U0HYG6_9FLAO|nr:hypothetical protein DDV96_12200 [Marixanthomonas spongiae]
MRRIFVILLIFNCCNNLKEHRINRDFQKIEINSKSNNTNEITDSDYYNFFNDVLKEKSLIRNNSVVFPDLKTDSEYWKEYFNIIDSGY